MGIAFVVGYRPCFQVFSPTSPVYLLPQNSISKLLFDSKTMDEASDHSVSSHLHLFYFIQFKDTNED